MGGTVRLASVGNVGRALLMTATGVAVNSWVAGDVRGRGLAIYGAGTFVVGLLTFEGPEWWAGRRRKGGDPGPPPPLPPGVLGSIRSTDIDGSGPDPEQ